MTKARISELQAAGLALAGYTFWVLADTALKVLGTSALPAYESVGGVGAVIVVLLLGYAVFRRNLGLLRPVRPLAQLLRSLLDLANVTGVVIALRHMPLPQFYLVIFAAPMVVTLLAALFLGERLAWPAALAILTGFLGVLIAVLPGGTGHRGAAAGYIACVVCVSAFSANMVWSRVMARVESPESLTFISGAVMAVAGTLATALSPKPVSGMEAAAIVASGLCCVAGGLCFFLALRSAPAATVSQYHYSQLVTGTAVSYVAWHQALTPAMLVGAVLIVGSGWYTAASAHRQPQADGTTEAAA